MLCNKCGAELHIGASYCNICGAKIEDPDLSENTSNVDTSTAYPYNNSFCETKSSPVDNIVQTISNITTYSSKNGEQMGSGFAIASMVLGICSIVFGCCFIYIGAILGLTGLVLGAIAIKNNSKGKGMAIAGLVCSIISVGWALVYLIIGASIKQWVDQMFESSKYI